MSHFPRWVQQQLPVIVTHRGAVDRELFDIFASDVQTTSNFSDAADRIRKLCEQTRLETAIAYYSHCDSVRLRGSLTASLGNEPPIEQFGSHDSQGEYHPFVAKQGRS